jgi:hypothetical protein
MNSSRNRGSSLLRSRGLSCTQVAPPGRSCEGPSEIGRGVREGHVGGSGIARAILFCPAMTPARAPYRAPIHLLACALTALVRLTDPRAARPALDKLRQTTPKPTSCDRTTELDPGKTLIIFSVPAATSPPSLRSTEKPCSRPHSHMARTTDPSNHI